ncbi:MAG: winged helix-turn-helix transcriptional regulator [Thaumarchaeota archaeon]|nr:winged helix-turn-helix transcriptional regulator [Nitrososphaerota archaeon]
MHKLDEQEIKIVKTLIRNPRISDNQIGKQTGVSVRTVNRKRKKLEQEGLLSYYTNLDMSSEGTGQLLARHIYLIKFRLGISQEKIINEVKEEPNVRTIYTEMIYGSHLAEIDGHTALVMIIEGMTDDQINIGFNSKIVPAMEKNHGKGCIEQVQTIRLGRTIRLFHNYLPMVNMSKGFIKSTWSDEAIFVGPSKPKET